MRILEYGNINNSTIMLVHGFESPYQIWIDYIEHYKENYHILVPILPGHDVREKSEFNSFDDTAKEIIFRLKIKGFHLDTIIVSK